MKTSHRPTYTASVQKTTTHGDQVQYDIESETVSLLLEVVKIEYEFHGSYIFLWNSNC